MLDTPFSENSFYTINVLTRSHTVSHTSFDDNVHNGLKVNDWNIDATKRQALDALSVTISALKKLEEKRFDKFCEPIEVSKSSNLNSRFYDGDD